MVKIKAGVKLEHLTPQMVLACLIVESVFKRGGYDPTITSGSDGEHKGRPVLGDDLDPHYVGKALDFRTHDLKPDDLPGLVQALKLCLGEGYVVLLKPDHLHIQWGHIA